MRRDQLSGRVEWMRAALLLHEGPLLRYATRLTGNLESARDVVQDTFLRLCQQRPDQLDSHLAAWLFTVCRNRALDLQRKDQRLRPLTDTDLATRPSDAPCPATAAADQETTQAIWQALAQLPPNQQEVIRLKFQNGLSYREISRITDLSESNVGFLIHTGLKTLRRRVRALEGVPHEP